MSQSVAIIDYGSGNLRSAEKAFIRAAADANIAANIQVTSDPEKVRKADRIMLPGVGAFGDCQAGLLAISGMREILQEQVIAKATPFLGVCVGMQLMANRGLEKGRHDGLGWLDGEVVPITPVDPALKIPHMGWNTLELHQPHPVFDAINCGPEGLHAYFVHSYHLKLDAASTPVATTNYGGAITAAVGKDNMIGTQFHPEKSQQLGLQLLANFLRWTP